MRTVFMLLLALPVLALAQEKADKPAPVWSQVKFDNGGPVRAEFKFSNSHGVYGMHRFLATRERELLLFSDGKATPVKLPDGGNFAPNADEMRTMANCACVVSGKVLYRVDGATATPITLDGVPLELGSHRLGAFMRTEPPILHLRYGDGTRLFVLDGAEAREVSLPEGANGAFRTCSDGTNMCVANDRGCWLVADGKIVELRDTDDDPVRMRERGYLMGDLLLVTSQQSVTLYRIRESVCHAIELPEAGEPQQLFRIGGRNLVLVKLEKRSAILEWKDDKLVDFAPLKDLDAVAFKGGGADVGLVRAKIDGKERLCRIDENGYRPLVSTEIVGLCDSTVARGTEMVASLGRVQAWLLSHIESTGEVHFGRNAEGVVLRFWELHVTSGKDGIYAFGELPPAGSRDEAELREVWFFKHE